MPAFQAEPGMPYWIDLTSSDVRKSSHFYSQVLGWEIEEICKGSRLRGGCSAPRRRTNPTRG